MAFQAEEVDSATEEEEEKQEEEEKEKEKKPLHHSDRHRHSRTTAQTPFAATWSPTPCPTTLPFWHQAKKIAHVPSEDGHPTRLVRQADYQSNIFRTHPHGDIAYANFLAIWP